MSPEFLLELSAFAQVIMVDLVLAGDNALVVGLAAAGLPAKDRRRVILLGIMAATVLRIIFAVGASQLLSIIGLTLAGGVLLLWVCWKLWREIENDRKARRAAEEAVLDAEGEAHHRVKAPPKTLSQAVWQIVLADVSMSLDNVLAVAGIARDHTTVLIFGLVLSVAFMGLAASFIIKLLKKYHWISYIGLLIILYVAGHMIWDGSVMVMNEVAAATY